MMFKNHLSETCGKHEMTPMARQAADLTEATSSCKAESIFG